MKCGPEICAETIWLEVVAMMLATKRTTIQYVTTSRSIAFIITVNLWLLYEDFYTYYVLD